METKLIRVLLIESEERCTRFMIESLSALTSSQIELSTTETLEVGIRKLRSSPYDAVLLNLFITQLPHRVHQWSHVLIV